MGWEFLQDNLLISIHAPRMGGDSQPSVSSMELQNFNPRPPRGGRQQKCTKILATFAQKR